MYWIKRVLLGGALAISSTLVQAAGLLTPAGGQLGELTLREHHVNVSVDSGYVTTSVEQVFANPHPQDLEAIYTFPVPEEAAVGEFTYWIDGKPVVAEVVEKQQAKQIYEQEKQAGRETALVEKDEYRSFDISVYPVKANSDVRIRLVYLQAAHVDTSVGRYVYPLEDGGVDEVKNAFWSRNEVVSEKFSFTLNLRSGYPVDALRLPQHPQAAIHKHSDTEWQVDMGNQASSGVNDEEGAINTGPQGPAAKLDQDIVVYWRLQEGLPGAMELVTYREPQRNEGTFMLTLTPGDDLKTLEQGRDWIFVLDVSGSMQGKYASLVEGIRQGLQKLRAQDRFKVVLFNDHAQEFTQGFLSVDSANVTQVLDHLQQYQPGGGTNLYAGLDTGVKSLDADRSAAVILVTDGVANVGHTEKKAFIKLLEKRDVRLFTFIMGNGANRPLLDEMTRVSKGFAHAISNGDDISGQIMLAAERINHEALRDIELRVHGVKTSALTPDNIHSLYRGEQLVVFGHYHGDGEAEIEVKAKQGGETKRYQAKMNFPADSQLNPELERLWAYAYIEDLIRHQEYFGEDADTKQAITDVASQYGLVTDYTSMIVLRDEVRQQLGIQGDNAARVQKEQQARAAKQQNPSASGAQSQPVSSSPRSYGGGGGGGSTSLWFSLAFLMLVAARKYRS